MLLWFLFVLIWCRLQSSELRATPHYLLFCTLPRSVALLQAGVLQNPDVKALSQGTGDLLRCRLCPREIHPRWHPHMTKALAGRRVSINWGVPFVSVQIIGHGRQTIKATKVSRYRFFFNHHILPSLIPSLPCWLHERSTLGSKGACNVRVMGHGPSKDLK